MNLPRAACLACALSAATFARESFAETTPPIVEIFVAGSAEAVTGSRDAVQDLCARSNVAVVVRDAAGADEALLATSRQPGLAAAYVDLRPGMPTRVVVVDGETRRDLERRILPESSSLEMSIETVAHVVCTAVESSLATRAARAAAVRAASAQKPSPPEPVRPWRSSDTAWESRLTVFAATENFGVGFRGGVGGALAVTAGRARFRSGALVAVHGYPSTDLDSGTALATFGLVGVRLMPLLEWSAADHVFAFAAAGGGVDFVQVEGEGAPPGTVTHSATALDGIAAGMVGVRFRFARGVGAVLAVDADVDFSRHRYVLETTTGNRPFFDPARVRPVALVGVSVSFGSAADEDDRVREAHQ